MKSLPITASMKDAIVSELSQSSLFRDLSPDELGEVATSATMVQCDGGETLMEQGGAADGFYLVAAGEVVVSLRHETRDEWIEVARVKPYETVGELGVLLGQPRSATVVASEAAILLRFDQRFFDDMFRRLPCFGRAICRVLGERLQRTSRHVVLPSPPAGAPAEPVLPPDPEAYKLLPLAFIQRHRVLALRTDGNRVRVGFVEDPTPTVMTALRELLPGMVVESAAIGADEFHAALRTLAGAEEPAPAPAATPPGAEAAPPSAPYSPSLRQLLSRVVAEGASDLHLSAGLRVRWRIDGDMQEIRDTRPLGPNDVLDLVKPIMSPRNAQQFAEDNDTDFAHAVPGLSRFRVNVFRDHKGVGAVLRQIPEKILSMEQLGLPPVVRQLCDYPKGLVLVTGPTGSGKSTTLAAMIDHINRTRPSHIITLEDPIEFVHASAKCLVNQREVGPHTRSFARALRAALREDPDIVLVGEMRDLETVALALETANTGHLVFATLHTNTAISTLARIIDMFPAEQQNQVRAVLADTLKGVIAQTLCRKKTGGRVAALEIMVSDTGISNLIREGKTQQMLSAMQTGKLRGNRILNEELHRLAKEGTITAEEAMARTVDKPDMASKLGLKGQAEGTC